jgi:uncharacterized protein YcbK (DUF882 family)
MSDDIYKYFSRLEILKGNDEEFPLTSEMEDNLVKLLTVLNRVRELYNNPMIISSGYRSPNKNAAVGGAKKSNHMMCLAADIADKDGKFTDWVMDNLDKVKECGVEAVEDPKFTVGWTHLQIVPVKSGKFVFKP